MIYKNGIDLNLKLAEFIDSANTLFIFSAYIKIETLKYLIDDKSNVKAVFVRWETKDLIQGASDHEIYPYLKSKGIALYRNPRLHLKAYLDDFKTCFLTTANISSRALNHPEFKNYNYEIGSIVEKLTIEDRLYFKIIQSESILITDIVYNQLLMQLTEKKKEFSEVEKFELNFEKLDDSFLISSLPMSQSVKKLCDIYNDSLSATELELNCLLHDLALYKIPLGLNKEMLIEKLSTAFFEQKFISSFLENMKGKNEIYFGEAKLWIQQNCTNVPLPRRWEITTNIQILYSWFVELGKGKYKVDIPGAHSERLRFIV
jgi:hypothetical protein